MGPEIADENVAGLLVVADKVPSVSSGKLSRTKLQSIKFWKKEDLVYRRNHHRRYRSTRQMKHSLQNFQFLKLQF
ncbi:hypothetical protein RvY_13019 [Ramazzottius varieornatus]|uniref:Uncharacterized protein n=1 Tax=Ramazzottius varieornatus TaxID=947166 RepID=A0A1D1VNP7_RAMVA|nr:hypothetical protein RvY_13019 [Ramazzottius varieornatus]